MLETGEHNKMHFHCGGSFVTQNEKCELKKWCAALCSLNEKKGLVEIWVSGLNSLIDNHEI